ncbi:protein of unknown function [Streptococcus thermophilus]|uniref:Uncharacterized protein n=1 Tax=Streptococcus thermophilus TaxID=1308 RepID=A0A8D6XRJ4_STRTR|nr:protein of unknown function [Streptococcus thermophilus]CAD0141833.1 protein of unknown function [Streptococcus thermophilus]CAD0145326.1 protein of unknown function [Streptococcus thermophilus]
MNFFNVKVDGNHITNSEGLDIVISEGQAKILREKGYQGVVIYVNRRFIINNERTMVSQL